MREREEIIDVIYLHIGYNGSNVYETFKLYINHEAPVEIIKGFLSALPFTAAGANHTVASGGNIGFLIPNQHYEKYVSYVLKPGMQFRSKSKLGSIFLANSQNAWLLYDQSQDHEICMPCILNVCDKEIPRLIEVCKTFWLMMNSIQDKTVLSLHFSLEKDITFPFQVNLKNTVTNNLIVDSAIANINRSISKFWLIPPLDLVQFMRFGHKNKIEGTNGHVFPMQVILSGVVMVLMNFIYDGPLNYAYDLLKHIKKSNDEALSYISTIIADFTNSHNAFLRSLQIESITSVCDEFVYAMRHIKSINEAEALLNAFNLFGARIHGWLVYFFPFYLGAHINYQDKRSFLPVYVNSIEDNDILSYNDRYNFFYYGFIKITHEISCVKLDELKKQKSNHLTLDEISHIVKDSNIVGIVDSLLGHNANCWQYEIINPTKSEWRQDAYNAFFSLKTRLTILISLDQNADVEFLPCLHTLGTVYSQNMLSDILNTSKTQSITLKPGSVVVYHELTPYFIRVKDVYRNTQGFLILKYQLDIT